MKIQIKSEDLKKKSLFIATPMYGGNCHGSYCKSMLNLVTLTSKYGIESKCHFIFNESLITRARNYCVDAFLRSGYSHLLFIDSDISFNAQDVIALLALQNKPENDDYDIIGAVYPKKTIAWEKIKTAVDKGFGDENPTNLMNYVADFVFNAIRKKDNKINLTEPVEVSELGTGFMMIRRETLEKYMEHYPDHMYLPDHVRSEHFDGSREIMCFFDTIIDDKSRRYLSEDYYFCQNARKAEMKVWMCPWMKLNHVGTYTFGGSLMNMAQIQASPTTDKKMLQNNKKRDIHFNSRGKAKRKKT